jgi:hypothetical protein
MDRSHQDEKPDFSIGVVGAHPKRGEQAKYDPAEADKSHFPAPMPFA